MIAGIVFLGIEMQQNNELLGAQARRDQLDARTAAGSMELNNADISLINFKVTSGDELTPYERYRFVIWARHLLGNWEWQYDEYQAGLLSEDDLPVAGWLTRVRNLPELRRVWDETKDNRSPEFILFMEENVFAQADSHL